MLIVVVDELSEALGRRGHQDGLEGVVALSEVHRHSGRLPSNFVGGNSTCLIMLMTNTWRDLLLSVVAVLLEVVEVEEGF